MMEKVPYALDALRCKNGYEKISNNAPLPRHARHKSREHFDTLGAPPAGRGRKGSGKELCHLLEVVVDIKNMELFGNSLQLLTGKRRLRRDAPLYSRASLLSVWMTIGTCRPA